DTPLNKRRYSATTEFESNLCLVWDLATFESAGSPSGIRRFFSLVDLASGGKSANGDAGNAKNKE
ncbi:MAG: hypothetical protein ACREDR_42370, partial [Blastocatellia bacterium]